MPAMQDWHTTGRNYTTKPDCEVLYTSRSSRITLELASHQHAIQNRVPFEGSPLRNLSPQGRQSVQRFVKCPKLNTMPAVQKLDMTYREMRSPDRITDLFSCRILGPKY